MASDAHSFEEVLLYLRSIRARGAYGTTELVWRGQDIVHVKQSDGFKPGELPVPKK